MNLKLVLMVLGISSAALVVLSLSFPTIPLYALGLGAGFAGSVIAVIWKMLKV